MTPVHIRFGGYQPPTSVHSRAATIFGQALVTRLGERVSFDLDGDIVASGHKAADLLTMVESGALTMGYFSASYLAARVPEFALLDLPLTITDRAQASAVLDGPLGPLLTNRLQATTGFRVLGSGTTAFGHRYITLTSHFFGAVVCLCHQASYAAWPAEVQQAVKEAAAEATAAQRRFAAAEDADVLAKLLPVQTEVTHLTDAERALFIEAVAPLVAEQRQAFGEHLFGYLV